VHGLFLNVNTRREISGLVTKEPPMTRLDVLIDAWRAAYCPAGGDPDAARWWDHWLDQFWVQEPAAPADCEAVASHHGLIRWRETESGLVGLRDSDRAGHYFIPDSVQVADQLTDDAWFACCEEERCPSFPSCDVLSVDDDWLLVRLPIGPARSMEFAEFAPFAPAGDMRRFKPDAA
jgi:hypothetical protein